MSDLPTRLVQAAWDGGMMHCDSPEAIVIRVLRELEQACDTDDWPYPNFRGDDLGNIATDVTRGPNE